MKIALIMGLGVLLSGCASSSGINQLPEMPEPLGREVPAPELKARVSLRDLAELRASLAKANQQSVGARSWYESVRKAAP
jgi:hypothetical protein